MTNREKLISMLVAMLDGKSDKELERIIDLVREYLVLVDETIKTEITYANSELNKKGKSTKPLPY